MQKRNQVCKIRNRKNHESIVNLLNDQHSNKLAFLAHMLLIYEYNQISYWKNKLI